MPQFREIYDMYREMENNNIILSFKGIITHKLLDSVYQVIDSKMHSLNEDTKKRKKVYNILVESLQNIYHHMDELLNGDDENELKTKDAMFMVTRGEDGTYRIQTGNFVLSSKCGLLKEKIEEVNALNPEELRVFYVDKLSTTEFSEKGGAGLGFIDIARKSGNKLVYGFNKVNDKFSFFSLMIIINGTLG